MGHGRWKRFKKELNWDLRDEECLKNIIIIKQSNFHGTHTYPLLALLEMSMTTSAPECSGKNPTNVAQYWKILGWYCHEPNYCYKRLLCPSLLKVDTFRAIFYFKKHCQRHNGPKGGVLLTKVTSLGHITNYYTNLDQTSSESRPSTNFKISTKHQHFNTT